MENNKDIDDASSDLLNNSNMSTQASAGPQTHRPSSPVPYAELMKRDQSSELAPPDFSSGPVPSGLATDHAPVSRSRPHLLKYACELTLDPNTAHRELSLHEGKKVVLVYETYAYEKKQTHPEHPERFDHEYQVLCREGLSGRCYWEAEWKGSEKRAHMAYIAVAYRSIQRKGKGDDVTMGRNTKSWSLFCTPFSYSFEHNRKRTDIPAPSSGSSRVGVYLDWPAGTLSFYSVSADTLTHLHTFRSTFTEPLCPGFRLYYPPAGTYSSVSLCQIT
ncbi:stonustoxin subunit beta-like [Sardina pilchardus]|uniref:stonustoxin subunit beta-like n=1 Tax=Sardina pilchardus TaxID=27697 RepID=UPI002E10F33E